QHGHRGLLVGRRDRDLDGRQVRPRGPRQLRMSLTFSTNDRSFSWISGLGRVLASCSTSFFCSPESLVGTTTRTVTCRSPRARLAIRATPWPPTRQVAAGCAPQ